MNSKPLDFLRAHWRPVVVLVALLLAFFAGRYGTPTKTVTVHAETDHTAETQLAQARAQINTLSEQVKTLNTRKHEVKTVYVTRDGTKTEQDVTDTDTEQTATAQTETQKVATAQTETHVDTTHTASTTTTVTAYRPEWRVSLLAGADMLHLDRPQLFGPIQLGAMVERRILGPVWVGAFGLSSGVGGLALSVEF